MFENLRGRTPVFLDADSTREYAVIAPFLPDTGELLFEVRSSRLSRQPGEICFPGGRLENGESPLDAAVRETTEELLIAREQIEIVAPLDILISVERAFIYPYLANIHGYRGTCNRDEVEETFTVPFQFFMKNPPQVYYTRVANVPEEPEEMYRLLEIEDYPWHSHRSPTQVYKYEGRVIWGMTAKFVHNLTELCRG